MARELTISLGQHSDKGRKEVNQDFHGVLTPDGQALCHEGNYGCPDGRDFQQFR